MVHWYTSTLVQWYIGTPEKEYIVTPDTIQTIVNTTMRLFQQEKFALELCPSTRHQYYHIILLIFKTNQMFQNISNELKKHFKRIFFRFDRSPE